MSTSNFSPSASPPAATPDRAQVGGSPSARVAPAPLLALGLALCAGQWIALASGADRARVAGALLVVCTLALAGVCRFLASPGIFRGWPLQGNWMRPGGFGIALALAAGSSAWRAAGELDRISSSKANNSYAEPAGVGRFRPTGPRTGRLDTQGSASSLAQPAAGSLLTFAGPRPRADELIKLLPPGERRPWARGPIDASSPLRSSREVRLVQPDECVRLAPARGWSDRLTNRIAPLRAALARRLDRTLTEVSGQPARGLGRALLVGDRSQLDSNLADLFTRTGTRHLLALSGFHVGVFVLTCLAPLLAITSRILTIGGVCRGAIHRLRFVLLAGACLVFVPLAGGSSPVSRAGLAAALFSLAGLFRDRRRCPAAGLRAPARQANLSSAFGLALTLSALAAPLAAGEAGLLMSFAATAGIALGAVSVARVLPGGRSDSSEPLADLVWVRSRPRLWAALLIRRLGRWARLGIAASLGATLATAPLVWGFFGEFSWVGPFATLALTPIVLVWMPLLWITALLEVSGPAAAAHGLESVALGILRAFDKLPWTPLALPPRPLWLLVLAAGLSFIALIRTNVRFTRASAFAFACVLAPHEATARRLNLHMLDVGHGSAFVLNAPGLPALVFDAGSRDRPGVARRALGPLLRQLDPGSVITLGSHTDADHRKALPWVASRFVTKLHAGALLKEHALHLSKSTRRIDLENGRLDLELQGGPLHLSLVRGLSRPGNEGSRSLVGAIGGQTFVLSGDAVSDGLGEELRRGWLPKEPRLLVAPHHGSFGSAVVQELEDLRPARLWVSVSGSPPMAEEYSRRGFLVHVTARDGPASLTLPEPAPPEEPGSQRAENSPTRDATKAVQEPREP